MATITRKFLEALGLNENQIESIIERHVEVVDAIKKERDGYKADAEKVEALTNQLKEAQDKLEKAGDVAKVQADFDAYKKQVEGEKTARQKGDAFEKLLETAGVAKPSARSLIRKSYDLNGIELSEDGSIKDADKITAAIKTDYADFIGEQRTYGTPTVTPPNGGGSKLTRAQIMSIKDTTERQKAIAENLDLFQKG